MILSRISHRWKKRRLTFPTSFWCCWMMWAMDGQALAEGWCECQWPKARPQGLNLLPIPHHGALRTYPCRAPHRPQPPFSIDRDRAGDGNRVSRLLRNFAEKLRHYRSDFVAQRIRYGMVGKEPQHTRDPVEPGRTIHALAHCTWVRLLLWIHGRGNGPILPCSVPQHRSGSGSLRPGGRLSPYNRSGGRLHYLDADPEGHCC